MPPIKIILFGATGMVGEGVLHEALRHADVGSVLVIGRRTCGVTHVRLKEVVHQDFFNYSTIENELRGYDACFFCLGVSSIGKNEQEYTHVTYDLTLEAGRTLSRLNPGMTFCYVSGLGTDSTEKGKVMWARVKGRTENDLMKLPFKDVYAFRPGFIKPTPGLHRAFAAAKILGVAYPIWKALLPRFVCTLEDIGRAMVASATHGSTQKILEIKDIEALARLGA